MRGTKLELEPRTTVEELDALLKSMKGLDLIKKLQKIDNAGMETDIPLHLSKNSEDVVTDYLSEIAREWYRYIRSQGRHTLNLVPFDIVITHPVVSYFFSHIFK